MNKFGQYFCQYCRTIHDRRLTKGVVFKTGFVYVSAVKYPMGLCQKQPRAHTSP